MAWIRLSITKSLIRAMASCPDSPGRTVDMTPTWGQWSSPLSLMAEVSPNSTLSPSSSSSGRLVALILRGAGIRHPLSFHRYDLTMVL